MGVHHCGNVSRVKLDAELKAYTLLTQSQLSVDGARELWKCSNRNCLISGYPVSLRE